MHIKDGHKKLRKSKEKEKTMRRTRSMLAVLGIVCALSGITGCSNRNGNTSATNGSDRKIQNAAYWKIANIELGYNFPNEWFGKYVSDVRFYVSAQNLHTFTGYKGYNVDYAGGTFTPGYNFCSYPTARTFMCGVHFTF